MALVLSGSDRRFRFRRLGIEKKTLALLSIFHNPAMDLLHQTLLLGGLIALVLFYQLWKVAARYNKIGSKVAPEPTGAWPVIGHLHLLGGPLPVARTLASMADKCGPVFTLRVGQRRTLVVSSWELTKECFTTNDLAFSTRPTNAAGEHLGFNYSMPGFAPYGPYWREIRKIATLELLSSRRLESLKHVRCSEADTCVGELHNLWVENQREPVKVEMKKWFEDLPFNVVVRMVAGKRYFGSGDENDEEARRFQKAIREFFYLRGAFVVSDALPFLRWVDVQGHVRAMKRVASEIESIARGWIGEHRRRRDSGEYKDEQDFVDVMLSITEKSPELFDNPDKVNMATSMAMIIAGTDTTSATLTWALSLILNNPHVLKKAQQELDSHVGKHRCVDESDVKNLVYLQAILKETLRLYPAAPLALPHEAIEDCQVGGFYVQAGTQLLVNLWKLHRDPQVWSDPLEFQPERFLDRHADVDVRGQHFECMPFGSGRRSCPGMSFALQVMHLTLARLIHSFDMSTPTRGMVDMTEGLGLTLPKATPLDVVLAPRLPSQLY